MSSSDCRAKIVTIASFLGVRPDYSVHSDLPTLGRFWLKEGGDESILVPCSERDRKRAVVLPFDPSIRRGPEAGSYCQAVPPSEYLAGLYPLNEADPSRSVDIR